MNTKHPTRREFLEQATLAAGVAALAAATARQAHADMPATAPSTAPTTSPAAQRTAAQRTAADIVTLGKTGLNCSRLGLGLGSNNGQIQARQGQENFNKFIKHAFDQGITLFDTAQAYRTFTMLGAAIKDLPRDKIFIQSKIDSPNNILNTIDNHRKTFGTDYVDSMLVHIQYHENWTDTWKRALDDYDTALDKKWIKSKGVSCHSLPALRTSIASDWTQVHLVRVNPQGTRTDSEQQVSWGGNGNDIKPVVAELKKMKNLNRGVIGMKIFGNGEFHTDADREKSARFAMAQQEIQAVIIGFANIEEFDKGLALINKVLADPAAT